MAGPSNHASVVLSYLVFKDAGVWEMLEQFGSNATNPVSTLENLFVVWFDIFILA